MHIFNKEQKKAVTYPARPLLILAGAGTGKTTTIIGRMARLIQNKNVLPETILALTFTYDAAVHLKKKLVDEIGTRGSDIHACTFHAFAQSQTMKYFQNLGYSYPPKLINNGDIYFLISRRFDELGRLRSSIFRRDPIQAAQSFKKIFEAFRYNLLDNQELQKLQQLELDKISSISDEKQRENIYQLADIVDIFPQYQRWKKEHNWIDYGDMTYNLWNLIKQNKNILNKLQTQYKHIIVDEFQDNNYALSKIMEKIAEPENSITVVGDDDQCIYAFRQANIQNVHQFKARYYTNNHFPISLLQNYRSCQTILDLANNVIAKNKSRTTKGQLTSDRYGSRMPKLYIGSEQDQLKQLAETVNTMLQKGEYPGNIAILMRSHGKCRLGAEYLNLHGIRTYYHADKLYEQPVIKDVISLLNIWGKTEKSEHALLRLLRNKLSMKIVASLTNEYINKKSSLKLEDYVLSQNNRIGELARYINKEIHQIKTQDVDELVWNLLKVDKTYFESEWENLITKKKWHALNRLRQVVEAYCLTYTRKDPHEFIKYINIQKEVNDEPLAPLDELEKLPAVRIMTVHSAKGMEFKHVFIPFLRSGTFPQRYQPMAIVDRLPIFWQRWDVGRQDEKELHYEEERRLFYVAITRAMETLTLFAPAKYQSPFIKEINEEHVKIEDIMKTEDSQNVYETLLVKYQAQMQIEICLRNFKKAQELLDSIKNIVQLSVGDEPSWNNNSMKTEIMDTLSNTEDSVQIDHPSLSATSIQAYQTCPLKYKYQYIDRIPGAPDKPYFQLGKVIHKVLELFHKDKQGTFNDLIDLLEIHWVEGGYQYKQEQEQNREDAEQMLKNYWNYIQLNPVNSLFTEHWFSFDTKYAKLHGKCDRIDLDNDNNISIIDYKTSKISKNKKELKKNIQLGIYAIYSLFDGIELEDKRIRDLPKKLSMLFLRESEPEVSVVFSPDDIAKFIKQIEGVSKNIQKGKFNPCKGKYCDWCDYKELICPEFG